MERTQEPREAAGASLLSSRVQGRLSLALLAALVACATGVAAEAVTNGVPHNSDPSFLDVIFSSVITVAAVRVALLFAGGYVVASVIGLVLARRWLTRIGAVEISPPSFESESLRKWLRMEDEHRQGVEARLDSLLEQFGSIEADEQSDAS